VGVNNFEHIGIVVDDLEAATAFFLDLGLERQGSGSVEGEWVDRVVGLEGVRSEIVFVVTPDGAGKIELAKFHTPADGDRADPAPANRLGLRHITFSVSDLDSMVAKLRDKGFYTVGEVEEYEGIFRLCYIRGPEGLIVELAERIGTARPE
jgi:catechol 2,3-dioxygenase-like lactoylglutathione lyase family enzyme